MGDTNLLSALDLVEGVREHICGISYAPIGANLKPQRIPTPKNRDGIPRFRCFIGDLFVDGNRPTLQIGIPVSCLLGGQMSWLYLVEGKVDQYLTAISIQVKERPIEFPLGSLITAPGSKDECRHERDEYRSWWRFAEPRIIDPNQLREFYRRCLCIAEWRINPNASSGARLDSLRSRGEIILNVVE